MKQLTQLTPNKVTIQIPRLSAIDFFCSVDKVKSVVGNDRVVLTFDGKDLPHTDYVSHSINRKKIEDEVSVSISTSTEADDCNYLCTSVLKIWLEIRSLSYLDGLKRAVPVILCGGWMK
ncbi:Cyanate hydratase [Artemisia annua]|uniref:Cyanate hydratase n=1 Tax=Artemisia annua TaxID=35608 RepID=A0A2U1MVS0_ARTAN|nr:Cyanate hydratase [Artemisia annua]